MSGQVGQIKCRTTIRVERSSQSGLTKYIRPTHEPSVKMILRKIPTGMAFAFASCCHSRRESTVPTQAKIWVPHVSILRHGIPASDRSGCPTFNTASSGLLSVNQSVDHLNRAKHDDTAPAHQNFSSHQSSTKIEIFNHPAINYLSSITKSKTSTTPQNPLPFIFLPTYSKTI